jgi:ribosome biogenesis protein ENP2
MFFVSFFFAEFRRRLELIQDFDFPDTAGKIKSSVDGQYVIATGVYPPQVRCFELSQLSLKFKRHIDCEVVQFQVRSFGSININKKV